MNPRFWERVRDRGLLFLLLAVSLLVLLNKNEPMIRGFRAAALEVTGSVETRFAWAGSFFRALDENERLRDANINLSSEVAKLREAEIQNERLTRMLALRDTTEIPMVSARIVGKEITQEQNFLTLDVGRDDSVAVGMAVVDDRGVIGKVVLVSASYALVMPYLNTEFRVSAKIQPDQVDGIVRWGGRNRMQLLMDHVVKTEDIRPNQWVVTSGYSSVFPPGYLIGTVDSTATRPGRNELQVYLTPAAPLHNADFVFVLLEKPDPERIDLEDRATVIR